MFKHYVCQHRDDTVPIVRLNCHNKKRHMMRLNLRCLHHMAVTDMIKKHQASVQSHSLSEQRHQTGQVAKQVSYLPESMADYLQRNSWQYCISHKCRIPIGLQHSCVVGSDLHDRVATAAMTPIFLAFNNEDMDAASQSPNINLPRPSVAASDSCHHIIVTQQHE